jgi:hypothetical protein
MCFKKNPVRAGLPRPRISTEKMTGFFYTDLFGSNGEPECVPISRKPANGTLSGSLRVCAGLDSDGCQAPLLFLIHSLGCLGYQRAQ